MVVINIKTKNKDELNVILLEIEKDTSIGGYYYEMIKLGEYYILRIDFTIKYHQKNKLINKYIDSMNKISLDQLFYLILQYNTTINVCTIEEIVECLINGDNDDNTSIYLYEILIQIDQIYNTSLAYDFIGGGV